MTAQSGGPQPVERYLRSFRDPDAAHAEIGRSYLELRVARVSDPEQFEYRTSWARAGVLCVHRSAYLNGLEADSEPVAQLGVITSTGGRAVLDNGREELYSSVGESYLCIPGLPLSMRSDHPAALIPELAYADVVDAAVTLSGTEPAGFRFLGMAPVSADLGAYWGRAVGLAHRQLAGGTYFPLVVAELYRLLVATVLEVFPNTTMTGLAPAGPGHVASAVVRRAMTYIEAHADQPLTVGHVATAVGVGPRGLQHAFARQHDLTPMGYLRRVRLERAHRELQAAEPDSGVTVAAVAARHGFSHPGRFSQLYARTYGRLPRGTLALPPTPGAGSAAGGG